MRKSVMVMVIVVEHISNSVNVDPLFRSIDRRELLGERDDDVIELKPENRTIHLVWSSSPSVLQFWSIKGVNNDSEDWESLVTQRVYIYRYIYLSTKLQSGGSRCAHTVPSSSTASPTPDPSPKSSTSSKGSDSRAVRRPSVSLIQQEDFGENRCVP
jgi:hypothetical protein